MPPRLLPHHLLRTPNNSANFGQQLRLFSSGLQRCHQESSNSNEEDTTDPAKLMNSNEEDTTDSAKSTNSNEEDTTTTNPPKWPTSNRRDTTTGPFPTLTHVSETGSARMVSISDKTPTKRTATAVCRLWFSDDRAVILIRQNKMEKGDVLGVARVAGIMAAKRTPDLIPLCHPIAITSVAVDFGFGTNWMRNGLGIGYEIGVKATVTCDGKTGVEMEALAAASTAALTIYDMCKAVDKRMTIEDLKVVLKEGGSSGRWVRGVQQEQEFEPEPPAPALYSLL